MSAKSAQNPFNLSPDPAYLYLTNSVAETLEKVRFTVDDRQGLTTVFGEVGHGKSTVMRYLHAEFGAREDCVSIFLPTPDYKTELGLLRAICGEFRLPRKHQKIDQESVLRAFLIECYTANKNAVILIDEAQAIKGHVLELVRTLLNYETDSAKLVQVVLCGQLELRDRLKDASKAALRSRIFLTSTLDPLTLTDTAEMIAFRTTRARTQIQWEDEAIEAVYRISRGVPRDVLKVCYTSWKLARKNNLDAIPLALVNAVERHVVIQ